MEIMCDNFKEILSYCLKLSPRSRVMDIPIYIYQQRYFSSHTCCPKTVASKLHEKCPDSHFISSCFYIHLFLQYLYLQLLQYSIFRKTSIFCKLLKNWIWQSADASKSTRYLQLKVSPLFQFFFSFFFKQKVYHHICLFYDTLA